MPRLSSDLTGALSQKLNQTEKTVQQVDLLDFTARAKLDSVTSDTRKLERTVQELLDQVEFMKNSDIRGEAGTHRPLWAGFIPVQQPGADVDVLSFSRGHRQHQEVLPAVSDRGGWR